MNTKAVMSIPRQTVWSGDGLPPVGTVCEGRARATQEWGEVVVLAHRIGSAVVSFTDCERLQWCDVDELRRILTPEQIAAEEREKAVAAMVAIMCKDGAFDADDPECAFAMEKLHDAGYRKVEAMNPKPI